MMLSLSNCYKSKTDDTFVNNLLNYIVNNIKCATYKNSLLRITDQIVSKLNKADIESTKFIKYNFLFPTL